MDLSKYDLIVINSSGGKDSLAALWAMAVMIKKQNFPIDRVIVSHQDLGRMEWAGTKELAKDQAKLFGFGFEFSQRITKDGKKDTILEYARRRKKWASNKQRWCTSDFKRDPGAKVVRYFSNLLGAKNVLHVFGFRAQESPARSKREVLVINKKLSTKSRTVTDYLPVHSWDIKKVWRVINLFKLPYHEAYKLGMPRLSCVFCIFSPFDALVIAGRNNPELLDEYIAVEDEIGHTFRDGFSLHQVKEAIQEGYDPKQVNDWIM